MNVSPDPAIGEFHYENPVGKGKAAPTSVVCLCYTETGSWWLSPSRTTGTWTQPALGLGQF